MTLFYDLVMDTAQGSHAIYEGGTYKECRRILISTMQRKRDAGKAVSIQTGEYAIFETDSPGLFGGKIFITPSNA